MILDTSALVAIVFGETEAASFAQLILEADRCLFSVANYLEVTMVVEGQAGRGAGRHLEAFLIRAGVILESVNTEQIHIARQAFLDFGKGRHPAGLNFGDCFAYALSKWAKEPLLFKGEDFSKTDVTVALA